MIEDMRLFAEDGVLQLPPGLDLQLGKIQKGVVIKVVILTCNSFHPGISRTGGKKPAPGGSEGACPEAGF